MGDANPAPEVTLSDMQRATLPAAALAVAGFLATGCRTPPAPEPPSPDGPADTLPAGPITFARHVAPIVFDHCAPCHRPGGSGPFTLLSYDDVARRARQIAEVTTSRFMPPWLPEAGFGEFVGERRLTAVQIATLAAWAESGAAEGDAADLPNPPVATEGWALGEPDLTVTLPSPYTLPADGPDVFRNLVMPLPVSETRWVKTVELRPGNPRFVHHAIMAVDDTTSSRRREADETEQPEQPGFSGWRWDSPSCRTGI